MENQKANLQTFVTVEELAHRLRRSQARVRHLARRGRLAIAARTLGGDPLFTLATLESLAPRIRVNRHPTLP